MENLITVYLDGDQTKEEFVGCIYEFIWTKNKDMEGQTNSVHTVSDLADMFIKNYPNSNIDKKLLVFWFNLAKFVQ